MNFIKELFGKFSLSLIWKGNKKNISKQTGNGLQINQEEKSTTNIFQIQTLNIGNIEELAGLQPYQDSEGLLKSAGQRFLLEQTTKQENLKNIVDKAELSKIDKPKELDKDWFLKWMDVSQGISKENVQNILAKILSGEIRNSGSFSIRTLEILKNLTKEELELFQIFCDLSYSNLIIGDNITSLICEPWGNPGSNGLSPLGLSYAKLTILQDAGLIQGDLNAYREYFQDALLLPFSLGSKKFKLKIVEKLDSNHKIRVTGLNFTKAGLEIRKVLNIGFNEVYNHKFLSWAKETWKLTE